MPHNPAETSLIFFSFSLLALYGPALLLVFAAYFFFTRKKSRLERKRQKQQRILEHIATEGLKERNRIALKSQRKNIRELARLAHRQLEARKLQMTPYMHQRTSAFIEKAVTTIDFDRLYALYSLFEQTEEQHISPAMETFFEQQR